MERVVSPAPFHEGKVNSLYDTNDPNVLLIRSTDRVSAENGKRRDVIPGKALANSLVSSMLFKRFKEAGIPTHVVGKGPDPFSKFIRKAHMVKLEVILRNITAGSFCKRYGVESGIVLSNPIVEYTYKNDELNDPLITEDAAISLEVVSAQDSYLIKEYMRKINEVAMQFFGELSLTLVDFKVEFGIDAETGELMLCDEFSLDTCRLWDESKNSWDKDIYRKDHTQDAIKKQATVYQQMVDKLKEAYPEEVKDLLGDYQE